MIIELENPRALGPDDPRGIVIVAQGGVITTRKVTDKGVMPFEEITPEGDFEEALAAKIDFLTTVGFQIV